jgi:hypothetical protein
MAASVAMYTYESNEILTSMNAHALRHAHVSNAAFWHVVEIST